jgi:hypothetical protein
MGARSPQQRLSEKGRCCGTVNWKQLCVSNLREGQSAVSLSAYAPYAASLLVSDVWAVSASFTVHNETLAVAVAGPRHRMEGSRDECAHLLVASCSFISRQF